MEIYIDESGDPGTGGQGTRWLTFGVVCCPDRDVAAFDSEVLAAQAQLGKNIHFQQMSHSDKRGVVERLGSSSVPWVGIVVATDTSLIVPGSALSQPDYQYNYALRYAVERASRLAGQAGERASVFIEARRARRTNPPDRYFQHLENQRANGFDWAALDSSRIRLVPKGSRPGLCVADALAHAAFRVLEPEVRWGHIELAYFNPIAGRIWRPGGTCFDEGVVVMPTQAHRAAAQFPMLQ